MNELLLDLRRSIAATLAFAVLLCGVYPLLTWGIAALLFPRQAAGSLIERDGRIVGSSMLGQNFSSPGYFHPRPSAAGKGYDAASSGGSNLGPIAQKLIDAVGERAKRYRSENGLADDAVVPADAVTSSGSGLDPDISPGNAALQAPRVAKERGLAPGLVSDLVRAHTSGPDLGFLGEAHVNVLELNLAVDELAARDANATR